MKHIIIFLVLSFPLVCQAQINGLGKLKIGQPMTATQAYNTLADDAATTRKVTLDNNHPNDSTYAEVKGIYKELGVEVNLTIFRKKLYCIRVTYASLDINSAEDKPKVDKYDAFVNAFLKKNGTGTISQNHTPYSCKCYNEEPVIFDNANIIRRWQNGTVATTLMTRRLTNLLSNKCVTSMGINLAIIDETLTSDVNKFFRDGVGK